MDVTITGRHIDLTPPMADHIGEHIEKMQRYASKVQYVTVTVDDDSGGYVVEILAKVDNADMVARADSHDVYESIDRAFAKMEREVARHHDKIVNEGRHRNAPPAG